ncbi:hypothetical protein BDZ89DRAFT_1196196 [Hymenopellis radicata]|nr:hypothetical protein BDZ89DRAFT_1196196 [Hymenopellis radicata]
MLISAWCPLTYSLVYLLLYRLERKLPTAVQVGISTYLIFDEHGATVNDIGFFDKRLRKCWALCGSNINTIFPCEPILAFAERIIQTPPPSPAERWMGSFKKQMSAIIIPVDLPTVMEIAAVLRTSQIESSSTFDSVASSTFTELSGEMQRNVEMVACEKKRFEHVEARELRRRT